jgi:periplasmic protein CpxP/Spy
MKKFVIAFIGVAVLVTGAAFVFAQTAATTDDKKVEGHRKFRRGGMRRGGHHHGMGMAFKALGLTEAQKAQSKEIMEASRAKLAPVFQAMKANRGKMLAATENGSFDEAAVTALANEHATLSAQMMVERARVKSQMFAILTDEQKAKLAEIKAKRGEGRKGHRAAKAEKVSE